MVVIGTWIGFWTIVLWGIIVVVGFGTGTIWEVLVALLGLWIIIFFLLGTYTLLIFGTITFLTFGTLTITLDLGTTGVGVGTTAGTGGVYVSTLVWAKYGS